MSCATLVVYTDCSLLLANEHVHFKAVFFIDFLLYQTVGIVHTCLRGKCKYIQNLFTVKTV